MPSPASMIVHNVFFTLNENSAAARQKLMDACHKYLSGHPGVAYFGAGTLCESLARPVNDRDFDVSLHVVFHSLADHDAYQQHPRHLEFVAENKATWKQVRVFDSVTG